MKNLLSGSIVGIAALVLLSGCAAMSSGRNPWAPPEKKKPVAERWAEAEKKEAEQKNAEAQQTTETPAVPAPKITVAESREVAEVVECTTAGSEKIAVAFRLGGIRVPVSKGDVFAVRGKDLVLRGIARLDIIDGDVLGFVVMQGNAQVGDMIAVPGEKLLAEMEKF